MKTKKQYRQGDVLIERVTDEVTKIEADCTKPAILAHGEVTGHAHVIERGVVLDEKASMLEVVDAIVALQHQEHNTIDLERGQYKVTRQRQYVRKEIKRVAD